MILSACDLVKLTETYVIWSNVQRGHEMFGWNCNDLQNSQWWWRSWFVITTPHNSWGVWKTNHKMTYRVAKNKNQDRKQPQPFSLSVYHHSKKNGGGGEYICPWAPLTLNPSMCLLEYFLSVCSLHHFLSSDQRRDPALTLSYKAHTVATHPLTHLQHLNMHTCILITHLGPCQ